MQIKDIRVYEGPNIYSHKPVVKIEVKLGELVDVPTKDIKGLNERLVKMFPGLADHKCSLGYAGGFLQRLKEGTYLAHVTEHLTLEIQRVVGHDVKFGKAISIKDDIYKIIYACVNPVIGKACGLLAVNIINRLVEGRSVDLEEELKKLRELYTRYSFGPSTAAIVNEAKRRGIPVREIANSGMVRLGYGKYQKYISATLYEATSSIAVDIACDKALTKAVLDEAFIPVPHGGVCRLLEEALRLAEELGYPVVVKPKCGNQGKFVFLDVKSKEELVSAFSQAKEFDDEVIIEEYISGKDYRLLVVGGKLVAASECIPAHVIGDGVHNIKDLISIENMDESRGEDHEKPLTKIKTDESVKRVLIKQGYGLESVPSEGELVWLRENANLSTGGMAVDCTDRVHPVNRMKAELAAESVGLDIAGIDMVIPDISKPMGEGYGAIVEVNAAPGIRMHLYPTEGKKRDVASSILDMVYPKGCPFTIPIVSITGTNGKTTTTRVISHILQEYGLTVGMTTTHGIYINKRCIEEGDTTGPKSALRVINNREVDAAVLETARGGIIRGGLAYEKADVAVFTNLSEDHLGFDGINTMDELLHVKSLVIEAVKEDGMCVLNADDKYVMRASKNAGGSVILYSMKCNNPHIIEHIKAGGCTVYTKDQHIFITDSHLTMELMGINDIPATLNGALRHNVYNSMAAIASAYALGVPLNIIRKALKSFSNDAVSNPGRFNMYDLGDFRVILDYGHNLDGYRVTIDGVRRLNPSRLVGIIGVPGNRRNEDIKEIGKLSGELFDTVIIKEDSNLRGRQPLEVANILRSGVIEGGMLQDNIEVVPNETTALRTALKKAKEGDIIVVFFEKMDPLVKVINQYAKSESKKVKKANLALPV